MRLPILMLCAAAPLTAQAVYQCKGADGKTTFQQTPCAATEQQKKVAIFNTESRPGAAAAAAEGGKASGPALTPDQRILAKAEAERQAEQRARTIADLQFTIDQLEAAISQRTARMQAEMAALQNAKGYARNNLAGATYANSLSGEMQAVAAKYTAMNNVDMERLKVHRAELELMRKGGAR